MAEDLGQPEEYGPVNTNRRRYPWKLWTAQPFVQWMLHPGIDFDGDPRKMDATIRTYAGRNGFGVVINAADPDGKGRVVFCFHEKGAPRPALRHYEQFAKPAMITNEAAALVFDPDLVIECAVCGAMQERPGHLLHVHECLVYGVYDRTNLYARHRTDGGNSEGLRKINQFSVQWNEENGPYSA